MGEALKRARPTVIALDCVSPQMNGPAVLHWLRSDGGAKEIPAILITVGKSQHRLGDGEATAPVEFVDVPMHQVDFVARLGPGWAGLALALLVLHFAAPFALKLILQLRSSGGIEDGNVDPLVLCFDHDSALSSRGDSIDVTF